MSRVDIAIIGAGAAGIAAARWLVARGADPLILEARNRVGGRAHTDRATFGVPIDLGCAWLHSADENPWTQIARDQGFTVIERLPDWRRRVGARLASDEDLAAVGEALNHYFTLVEAAGRSGRDVAVTELIPKDSTRPLFDAIMTWLMGIESDSVSSLDLARYQENETNWAVTEGLGSVVARAADALKVRLNTPVQSIRWTGEPVLIETAAGRIEAGALIVTAPTNVLAESRLAFEPSLPVEMQNALRGVPLGIANKVFFELEPGALPYEGTTHFIGTDKSARTGSYAVRPGGQELLLGYFGGRFARELEERGALEEFAREELNSIFGAQFTRKIQHSFTTGWSVDPWSRGSYSAARPGCARMRETLNEPIGKRVFLAGEACSIEHFGTIRGAWESGLRAAEQALRVVTGRAD